MKWFIRVLTFIALASIFLTVWYYLGFRLGILSDALAAVCAVSLIVFHEKRNPAVENQQKTKEKKPLLFPIMAIVLFLLIIFIAIQYATDQSIRTPWPLLPHGTLLLISLLFSIPLFWSLFTHKIEKSISPLAFTCSLSILSITLLAPIIYKLGFGFDGFLHRASENILLSTGTLTPKPPYYIGQYVFISELARLFHISIKYLDIFLVPIFTALIPWIFVTKKNNSSAFTFIALPLLIPFSLFIATTPQSFAYLLGLFAIILSLHEERRTDLTAITLVLWSLTTHPLAGLPFVGALAILFLSRKHTSFKLILRSPLIGVIFILTLISIPVAFHIRGLIAHTPTLWNFSSLIQMEWIRALSQRLLLPNNHQSLFADVAAWTRFLFPFILLTLTIYAIKTDCKKRKNWIILLSLSTGLACMGAIFKFIGDFSYLIEYERSDFAERLSWIALLLLIPPALYGLQKIIETQFYKSKYIVIATIFMLSGIHATNAYNALPRHDATEVGHGWSVGSADLEIVQWIQKDAESKAYVVLANQTVSAAAIHAFGFARYAENQQTKESIFYYPIPTGGSLYQLYLQITKNPSRRFAKQASELGQSKIVYVVINEYWTHATRVSAELKTIADKTHTIQNGKINIFKFIF